MPYKVTRLHMIHAVPHGYKQKHLWPPWNNKQQNRAKYLADTMKYGSIALACAQSARRMGCSCRTVVAVQYVKKKGAPGVDLPTQRRQHQQSTLRQLQLHGGGFSNFARVAPHLVAMCVRSRRQPVVWGGGGRKGVPGVGGGGMGAVECARLSARRSRLAAARRGG